MKLRFKKIVLFIISVALFCGYSPQICAETWALQDCVDAVKENLLGMNMDEEDFRLFCIKKYMLLSEYLNQLKFRPLADLPEDLLRNMNQELKRAKELSQGNVDDFWNNLIIMREAFLHIWQEDIFKGSSIPVVYDEFALCATEDHFEYFKNFVRKSYPPTLTRGTSKVKFRIVCFRKYFLIDKYLRYLSFAKQGLTSQSLMISKYELMAIDHEVSEAKKFFKESSGEFISILRIMRDEFLLMAAYDINSRPS